MRATTLKAFEKNLACPSSNLLQLSVSRPLSPQIKKLVQGHIEICEFCAAELELLTRYPVTGHLHEKPPEVPMNLRILAESIFSQSRRAKAFTGRKVFFK